MKINVFKTQCSIGVKVKHIPDNSTGTVVKISRDKTQALVLFENSDTIWIDYYKLDFVS